MTTIDRNKWLIDNQKLILKICAKWNYRRDYEDILQTAYLGAIAALDKSNDNYNNKALRAFVSSYIDGYVMNYCIKKDCVVGIPRHAWDHGVRVDVISIDYEYEDGDFEEFYLGETDKGYEEAELMTDFRSAISKLPEKVQKTALMLAEGYERKDAAEVDGCSRQNINLRVKQIQEACRPLYA